MKKLVIGISEGSRYINYENWIKDESRLEILKLSYRLNNLKDFEKCDGFILTAEKM